MSKPTVKAIAELVARYVARHAEQESLMLSPFASWTMRDPHGLLNELVKATRVPQAQFTAWVDEEMARKRKEAGL